MARTYRRSSNKKGTPKPHINLDRERREMLGSWGVVGYNLSDKFWRYYKRAYYTSDRSFTFNTKPLKKFEHKYRRAATRMNLNKVQKDTDFADEMVFLKMYENPWRWD